MELAGAVCVVTGAGNGIGAAVEERWGPVDLYCSNAGITDIDGWLTAMNLVQQRLEAP